MLPLTLSGLVACLFTLWALALRLQGERRRAPARPAGWIESRFARYRRRKEKPIRPPATEAGAEAAGAATTPRHAATLRLALLV